jgi:signal transduction histidine kinase
MVTCRRNDFVIVQDASGGIQLETTESRQIEVGTAVEAVGVPSPGKYGLALAEALLRQVGPTNDPQPMMISSNALIYPEGNCGLVSLEAVVLEQHSAGSVQTLDLQAGQRVFRASLPKAEGALARIAPGSRIRLSGVAVVEGADLRPIDGRLSPVGALELLLRSPRDVGVLERPPWWNWKYTMAICALIAMVFALGIVWIRTLRKRVEQRTQELRHTMARLEKETRISATLAERDRLAGEIHDSVEQGLSAIVMQMEAAARLTDQPEEMSRYLHMAKNMASFSRAEVQHAVWDLQSPLLENSDLAMALRRVAQEISAGNSPRVTVEISGSACPLPSAVEHHLLRMAQEAITNAVKHGNCKSITLQLHYAPDSAKLSVRDDGVGFVPEEVSAERGHFGLQGMRARAVKIGAELRITSQPGQGTSIQVVVPCASAPHNCSLQ